MSLDHRRGAVSVGPSRERILCAWDDCERRGVMLHQARVEYGTPGHPYRVIHLFCTERHRQLWINGHIHYGRLPTGERGRLL